MADWPRVGVVTVSFNSAGVIDEFMASMLAQRYDNYILYVIDNASSDNTLSRVGTYSDHRVAVLANPENAGVAAGNNQGIRAALDAGCDYVLLINNDTVFGPDLLERLVADMRKLGCGLLTPKTMYHGNSNVIWCAGGEFDWWRAYRTVHYGQGELDVGQYDVPRRIDYAPTCCMMIDRGVFERIGLMDEKYFVYFDDADFCFRANRASLSMYYTPEATVFHKVSSLTGGGESSFTITLGTRNKVYFIKKNSNPLLVPFWLLLYQILFLLRVIARKDGMSVYLLKQKSFMKGLVL